MLGSFNGWYPQLNLIQLSIFTNIITILLILLFINIITILFILLFINTIIITKDIYYNTSVFCTGTTNDESIKFPSETLKWENRETL